MRGDFNHSAEKLQTALVQVSRNARGIDAGANEIKAAADDLAKRTEQQAAAVEETAAAYEQSSGLQQINTAVNQMDQDTQKNAAMVEETIAASHSLAKEVASLNRLLAQFRLGGEAHVSVAGGYEKPVTSPARALGRKIATAFSGNAALDVSKDNWQEF